MGQRLHDGFTEEMSIEVGLPIARPGNGPGVVIRPRAVGDGLAQGRAGECQTNADKNHGRLN
jgi:hypothetical protein